MSITLKRLVTDLLLQNSMPRPAQRRSNRPLAKPARGSSATNSLKAANAEHQALIRYIRAAVGILPKAECQLLMEFADIAKRKCEQLSRRRRACARPATA